MRLSFTKLTPEVRAIRKLLHFAGLQVEMQPFDKEQPELEVDDHVLVGWKTIFAYAGRASHALPSDPLASAVVMQWVNVEAPDENASEEEVKRLVQLIEDEFDTHDGDFLCDRTLARSSAADFLWKERLLFVKTSFSIDWDKYPRVAHFLTCDPALDERDEDAYDDQSEDDRPSSPELSGEGGAPVGAACVVS